MTFQKIERIQEVWKLIEGFETYEVSNTGKIKRKERKVESSDSSKVLNLKEKVMKQRWNKNCKCFF
jgi:hypothetical protein